MSATLAAHLLWLLSCLPSALAWLLAALTPRVTQQRILRRILKRNATTDVGQRYGFRACHSPEAFDARVPISTYADIAADIAAMRRDGRHMRLTRDPVTLLEPTGGSGDTPKLIPFTAALQREFLAAIRPWMAMLYLRHPTLLTGRHYWSISPATPVDQNPGDRIPVGFADDTEYLGRMGRWLARHTQAVPSAITRVGDPESFPYLTLLFLLRADDLTLISVWHPSFLCVLLDALPRHRGALLNDLRDGRDGARPCPRRAAALADIDFTAPNAAGRIWPRLRLISCWTREADPWIERLRAAFPRAHIQAKGLIATEGVVTIPVDSGTRHAAAVRSHFLEFVDPEGHVRHLWELEPNTTYRVLLTTGGGLYRYDLADTVRMEGRFLRTPCLRFTGRAGIVSDRVGEKIDLALAEQAVAEARTQFGQGLGFMMLAPSEDGDGGCRYVCFADGDATDLDTLADTIEDALNRNYHYRHARAIGQLKALRVFRLTGDPVAELHRHERARDRKPGDIKLLALSRDSGWEQVFTGCFLTDGDDTSPT